MPDLLQRDQAPLTPAQWAILDQTVVQTARAMLVGRRVIALAGPFGPGIAALPSDTLGGTAQGRVDLLGAEGEAIGVAARRYVPLPIIAKDFWLYWRDLEASRQLGLPLETGAASAAAAACAQAEDSLIVNGDAALGLLGLRTADRRQVRPMGDWDQTGQAFADVVEGVRALVDTGFTGPFALLVSPRSYARLNRIFDNSGVLELEQIEKLARRGVYQTSALADPGAILLDPGMQNMDIAVAQDLVTAFVESANLNFRLRVMESLVLRIRRAGSICSFEG